MSPKPVWCEEVDRFLKDNKQRMPNYYRSYTWEGDIWDDGFPQLFELERIISQAAKDNLLEGAHLKKIADWGKLPNKKPLTRIKHFNITLYGVDKQPVPWLRKEPENAICIIEGRIRGFGPTYSSKLLHFAVPQIFGALDTRLVQIFGKNSNDLKSYRFLDLEVSRPKKGRPSIDPKQDGWPEEYGTLDRNSQLHGGIPKPEHDRMSTPGSVLSKRSSR